MIILQNLSTQFKQIRSKTEDICNLISEKFFFQQTSYEVSPPAWHLGHTSWLFETLILKQYLPNYEEFDESFSFYFNSYYNSFGEILDKGKRSKIQSITKENIYKYRNYVNNFVLELLDSNFDEKLYRLIETAINHEQQHQELLLYDIQHIFFVNDKKLSLTNIQRASKDYLEGEYHIEEGIYRIGNERLDEFAYDNERESHKVYLEEFSISKSLVRNFEYLEFLESEAYNNHKYWLSDAWEWKQKNKITSPLYWEKIDAKWYSYNLQGLQVIDEYAPICNISFYEASAYCKWKGERLPTEFEWEAACKVFMDLEYKHNNLLENKVYSTNSNLGNDFIGNAWEWTNSAYLPYPRFKEFEGILSEYNAKFMINQMVLRGGSWATPKSHIRPEYRNFFRPESRWQASGFRTIKKEVN